MPRSKRPGSGFPVAILALDPANSGGEWQQAVERLGQAGTIVVAIELPAAPENLDLQAATFLEAAWVAIALKIGGLAGSPVHLTWWGCGLTGPVVEQAARLTAHKYYLPPTRVLLRPFDEIEAASPQPAPTGPVDLKLAKAC
jgi:hypothetical protein